MNFLWPLAWFLSVLAIPVVVLYLIRTLPRKKPVSTLLFWEQLQPQLRSSPLWRKLRRFISLLLQLAFLFLLIFLLARPLLPWENAQPQTTIFIIDTSASMGASQDTDSPIQSAREILRERITNLRPSDEVMIIGAGNSPEILQRWTGNRHLLLNAASKIQPNTDKGDLRPAIQLAQDLAAARENPQIVLLSDAVIDHDAPPLENHFELIHLPPPEEENFGITAFAARRSRIDPGTILVQATLIRSAEPETDQPDPHPIPRLELRLNDQLFDVLPLQFDESGQMEKFWRIPAEGAVTIEAQLQSEHPDALPQDDHSKLTLGPVPNLPVYLVSPPHAFLEAALTSLDFVEAARIPPGELPATPAKGLYIFHQTTPPDDFNAEAMLLIQPENRGFWGERSEGETEENLITDWDEESDLLRHVQFDQVAFSSLALYSPSPSASVLATTFGQPALFGDWSGDRRWIVTAFGLDQTDLVYRTVFPIFVGNIVRSLSPSAVTATAALPGLTESRLDSTPARIPVAEDPSSSSGERTFVPHLSLRTWLLILAIAWTLLEWRLFHRRITE